MNICVFKYLNSLLKLASFINISEATSLAIHSMAIISNSKDSVNANEIANKTDFSRNHLAKILQILVKNNFLESTRGPKGGFYLKKPANEISLLNIYELLEGELETEHCRRHFNKCPFDECVFGNIREKVSEEVRLYFSKRKLSDIKTTD